jgi:hypothetical protein
MNNKIHKPNEYPTYSTINFFINPCYAGKNDAGPDSRTETQSKNFTNTEKCH